MRNPAPLVLSFFLAVIAVFFILRKPETPPAPPAAETAPETASETETSPPVWPHETSDIPADSKATFGKLPNGLRYIIYPNTEPPRRVSLRLHIAAGSLMEADDQQGLAHFLEHMVFNGSKNFTPDELIPRMQRLGIAFGAHANAYTSFDETVYMLDLPDLSDETLDLGFTVMRDFGDGAKLDIEEIDKERGVILSEKTSRDTVGYRLMQQQFEELLPDSLVPRRFPIGVEEVISNAPRERFVDFYAKYYTPDRMTFIVVGDIDPATMEGRIREAFGTLANPAESGKDPDLGTIAPPDGIETAVFSDKEVASNDLSLVSIRPFERVPDTRTRRLSLLPLDLAHAIIGRRFDRISKQEGSPIADGSASRYDLFNHAELGSFDVTVAGDRWQEALPVLEQEFRRALEHGFTEAELAEAKANLLNAYEQAVKAAPTRKSEGLATMLARSINDGTVFSTPETNLAIAREGLDAFTPEACHQAFRHFWADQGLHLVLTAREEPDNARATLLAIYDESRSKPVEAPEQKQAASFGYTDFGPAGGVTSRTEIEDPGLVQFILSNGVRFNFKRTDFEKSGIRLLARIGSGKLTQPQDSPGLDLFTGSVFDSGGLGKHSVDDLRQILAGRTVGSGLSIGEDAFNLTGRTTPDDLELQLQLMCAQIADPGYREEALVQFRKGLSQLFQQLRHSPAGSQAGMNAWLHGEDSRWAVPDEAKLAAYTLDDARDWLQPALAKDYLELSVVGDIDEEILLPLVLKTFGALPARAESKPDLSRLREVKFPTAPATRAFTYDSKIEQGTATVVWKTDGVRGNQRHFRRLNLVAEILTNRLREEIREKLGASYSPNAGATGSDALDGFGYLLAEVVGKKGDVQRLADLATDLAAELAAKGATDDELDRARKPLLSQLEKSKRDNGYWLGVVLSQSQEDPARLDLIRDRDADYAAIDLAELNEIAARYLPARNALKMHIHPVQ